MGDVGSVRSGDARRRCFDREWNREHWVELLGAVLAAASLFWAVAMWKMQSPDVSPPSTPLVVSPTGPAPTSSSGRPPALATSSTPLYSLPMTEGREVASRSGGADLTLSCGSNTSDARHRDVVYDLTMASGHFVTTVGVASGGHRVQVDLTVADTYENSTRQRRVDWVVVRPGEVKSLKADFQHAQALSLRVTCERPFAGALLHEPRLVGWHQG